MATVDLLDLSDLIGGFEKDLRRTWGFRGETSRTAVLEVPEADLRYANESPPLDLAEAVLAIDRVLATYPGAVWSTSGDHGRIVAGDRLISLSMATVDDDAELLAWIDASHRLGGG